VISPEQIQKREPLTGAASFLDRIIYAKREQKTAMVLYFAATHALDGLNTIGRLLVTSDQPNSGKTTVLDAAGMLCQNFWMADPTKWALQAKFTERDRATVGLDEISQVFGTSGLRGRGSPLYKPLVEGYRRTATFSISVDRTATDISAYSGAVLAGLRQAVPPDLYSRCIQVAMTPCPATIDLEDSLDEGVVADGQRIGLQIHNWARMFVDDIGAFARDARKRHPKLKGRKLQVWGSLFAIAEMAGGEWPQRCMDAFMAIALDETDKPILSAEQQLLSDAGAYLAERSVLPAHARYLFSGELLSSLRTMDEKLYTSKTDRQMAMLMKSALGPSRVITLPSRKTVRGWEAAGILAEYQRLLDDLRPEVPEDAEDEYDTFFDTEEPEEEEGSDAA